MIITYAWVATAIHEGKHRVSSDPRSQAFDGVVSTMMGDRMGIRRAVVFLIFITIALCLFIKFVFLMPYRK